MLPEVLNSSVGGYPHISRGKKLAQGGVDAYKARFMSSALDLPQDSTPAVISHDLNMNVGDGLNTYIDKFPEFKIPVYFCGRCSNADEA